MARRQLRCCADALGMSIIRQNLYQPLFDRLDVGHRIALTVPGGLHVVSPANSVEPDDDHAASHYFAAGIDLEAFGGDSVIAIPGGV